MSPGDSTALLLKMRFWAIGMEFTWSQRWELLYLSGFFHSRSTLNEFKTSRSNAQKQLRGLVIRSCMIYNFVDNDCHIGIQMNLRDQGRGARDDEFHKRG